MVMVQKNRADAEDTMNFWVGIHAPALSKAVFRRGPRIKKSCSSSRTFFRKDKYSVLVCPNNETLFREFGHGCLCILGVRARGYLLECRDGLRFHLLGVVGGT